MLSTTYVKKYTCDRCGKTARYRFNNKFEKPSSWLELHGRINGCQRHVSFHFCQECYDELFGAEGFVWEDGALDKITVLQDTVYTLTQLLEAEDDVEGVAIDDDYTIHVQYRGNDDEEEEEVEWFGVEDAFDEDEDEEDETPTVADVLEELDMLAYLKEQAEKEAEEQPEEEPVPVEGNLKMRFYTVDEAGNVLDDVAKDYTFNFTCVAEQDEEEAEEQPEEEDAPVYGTVEVQYYSAEELNDMLKDELPKVMKWTCTPGDDEDFIGLTD